MATPIKLKRSAVAGKRPGLSDLQLGELALNTNDGNIFIERDAGGVGIATTIANVTPWTENYGGESIYYNNTVGIGTTNPQGSLQIGTGVTVYGSTGIVSATKFYGDGSTLSNVGGNLNITGDSGGGAGVNLVTQTLTIVGTANEVTTSADSQQVQIGFPDTVNVSDLIVGVGASFVGIATFSDTLKVGTAITAHAGIITATKFKPVGGTSTKFLKGDGSLDSNVYLTNYSETSTLDDVLGRGNSSSKGVNVGISTLGNVSGGFVKLYNNSNLVFQTVGTGVSIANAGLNTATIFGPPEIIIDPHPVGVATTSGIVRIKGDLYVDGKNFIIDSETISLGDFVVGIASTATTDALADGAGLLIGPDNTFKYEYNSGTDPSLKSSENLNVATGKGYQIAETEVLNATTLGSAVVNSSLTSVGTLGSLNVSGNAGIGSLNVTGVSTFNSTVTLVDDQILGLGDENDLRLHHTTSVSYIDNYKGSLYIRNNVDDDDGGNIIIEALKDETSILCEHDAAVKLYYNNAEKLATTDTGVSITGEVKSSLLTANRVVTVGAGGSLVDNPLLGFDGVALTVTGNLFLPNTGNHMGIGTALKLGEGTDALSVWENAANSGVRIWASSSDHKGTSVPLQVANTYGTEYFRVHGDGNVGIGTTNPLGDLQVGTGVTVYGSTGIVSATKFYGDGSNLQNITASGSGIVIKDGGSLVGTAGTINFGTNLSVSALSGGSVTVTASGGGASGLWAQTDVGINTSSNVGIGTTNPQGSLQVGTGVTVYGNAGIVSATSFDGSGANLTNLPADSTKLSLAGGTMTGDLLFGDDVKSIFGDSSQLQIYFDGTDSRIYSTGNIFLQPKSGENGIKVNGDGSVQLFYNNAERFSTSGLGVTVIGLTSTTDAWVSGAVTATTYYGDGSNLVGTGDTSNIVTNSLEVSGITTVGFATATDVWVSGAVTATTYYGGGANLTSLNASELDSGTIPSARYGAGNLFVKAINNSGNAADNGNNISAGNSSGIALASGAEENTFYGIEAGRTCSTGDNNTFIGAHAGENVDTSGGNVAIGQDAFRLATGSFNTVVGMAAADSSTFTGDRNIVIGKDADPSSITISNEITLGDSNITRFRVPGVRIMANTYGVGIGTTNPNVAVGVANTGVLAVGIVSAYLIYGNGGNITGVGTGIYDNTLLGLNAGNVLVPTADNSGGNNTFIGARAGVANTTGGQSVVIGSEAGKTFTGESNTGHGHVYIGRHCAETANGGNYNTAIGKDAFRRGTGSSNVVIGHLAADSSSFSGSRNIIIGDSTEPSSLTSSNEITLGDGNITRFRIPGLTLLANRTGVGIGTTNPTGAAALTGNTQVLAVGVVTATSVYGTLQTAAQTNITSVGTLDGIDVTGHTETDTLNVSGIATIGGNRIDIATWISHSGDDDTRFGFYGPDELTFETAGTERLHIDADGNVGINSENPRSTLDVRGRLQVTGVSTFSNTLRALGGLSFGTGNSTLLSDNGMGFELATTNGDVTISTNLDDKDVKIQTDNGSGGLTNYFLADGSTGSTLLYYYGTEKIKTTTHGIDVTGHVETDTLQVSGITTVGFATATDVWVSGAVTATTYYGDGSNLVGTGDTSNIVTNSLEVSGISTFTGIYIQDDSGNNDVIIDNNLLTNHVFISLKDDCKAQFGNGTDLQIWHTGDDSYILDQGVGDLIIGANDAVKITNAAGTENKIVATSDGSVDLYYDNAKKFETTSTGSIVTGVLTATTFSGSGASLSSIPNSALDNSTVSYGGISLALGGTDATPAFNLSDATAYPYTSLTGITTTILGDTTPKLGGNLNGNSKDIYGVGIITATTKFSGSLFENNDGAVVVRAGHPYSTITYKGYTHTFTKPTDGGTQAKFEAAGACSLYHNNSLRFNTSGIGISVAGVGNTAYIEGPEEIWIDPHPTGVGATSGIVRIRGDLYVDGTEFIVDVDKLEIGDFQIGIATTVGTNAVLDGAGIGIGSTGIRKTITWSNGSSSLKSSENWNLASGKHYEIAGTDVLTSTTLGSGVVSSSLTSLGTIASLVASSAKVSDLTSGRVVVAGTAGELEDASTFTFSGGTVTATAFAGDGSALTGITTSTQIVTGNTSVQTVDTGSDGAIIFTTEGTEKARIRTDGNLGLGIDNPLTKIHAYGSTPTITFRDNTANATLVAGAAAGNAYVGSSSNHPFLIKTNNSERLRIDTNGNVNITGIATVTRHFSGDIAGVGATFTNLTGTLQTAAQPNVTSLGTIASLVASTAKVSDLTVNRVVYVGSSGELQDSSNFGYNGVSLSVNGINVTGNILAPNAGNFVAIGTASALGGATDRLAVLGSSTDSGVRIWCSQGVHKATAVPFQVATSTGSELFRVNADGNIGINSSVPSSSLDVRGTVTATAFSGDGSALTDVSATDSTKLPLAGGTITGNVEMTGNVFDFAESKQLRFGAGDDFAILHNGNTLLENETTGGNLTLNNKSTSGKIYLNVSDGDNALVATPDGSVEIHYANAKKLETTNTGVIITGIATATDFDSTSDIRLKTNIKPIDDPLAKVIQIEGVSFNWKEGNRPALGVIADQVEEIIPELVHGDDPKTVNYNGLIGLLIEAVKEQQTQIDSLKNRLSKLE